MSEVSFARCPPPLPSDGLEDSKPLVPSQARSRSELGRPLAGPGRRSSQLSGAIAHSSAAQGLDPAALGPTRGLGPKPKG